MTLLAVPNLSEGRDMTVVGTLRETVTSAGARLLDSHSDPIHNRTVFTVSAAPEILVAAMADLAVSAARSIDLTSHQGVHPRVGVLDVCPFVPHRSSIDAAVEAALDAARRIGELGFPVFLYGKAGIWELPELRRGGLEGLIDRVAEGLAPDHGPGRISPERGVVCVGARGPLIAFNVNIDGDLEAARTIARAVRAEAEGLPGVRALGLPMTEGAQVSMNITQPEDVAITDVFAAIEGWAARLDVEITSTEIVGLVEQRFLPDPDAKATRLLIEPGRSVESALRS